MEIVRKFKHISKVVSEKDHGIYDAINKGVKISEGEIIGFLNSDDTFYDSNILKIISESFNNETDCIFGNLIYTDKNEKIKGKWMGSNFKAGKFKKDGCQHTQLFIVEKRFIINLESMTILIKLLGILN